MYEKFSHGIRYLILSILVALIPAVVCAMIRYLPFPALVKKSDLIVLGKVLDKHKGPPEKYRAEDMNIFEVKNIVLPEKILKGTWPEGENMMFLTFETTRKGELALLEDVLYFPEKGNRVLLFLTKSPGGELKVMNGPQGLWRVKDDGSTLVGILKQVEDEIKDPTSAKDYFNKALEAKDIAQQISFYTKAVQLDPNYALAYYNRGKLYYNLKNYKQALNDFNKTISLKPDYALAYYMRASLYNQTGNYEQARDDYNKAKTLNPKIPDLDIKSPN